MDLAELLLFMIGRDRSKGSVKDAVRVCNLEMIMRIETVDLNELRQFWRTYRRFDGLLSEAEKNKFLILKAERHLMN